MTQLRPPTGLFRLTFAHLPEKKLPPVKEPAVLLKIFGFFDFLLIEPIGADPTKPAAETNHPLPADLEHISDDRQQRVLLAYGRPADVYSVLKQANQKDHPAYLAVSLIKLSGPHAHEGYREAVHELAGRKDPGTVYLTCLDAPDVIVLKAFGGAVEPKACPLDDLIQWMNQLRLKPPFDQNQLDRSLTMVACQSPETFFEQLALAENSCSTQALVRITDMGNGAALQDLCRRLDANGKGVPAFSHKLLASVGYYDVQGLLTIREAALVIEFARVQVENRELTTSTCFVGARDLTAITKIERDVSPLLKELTDAWQELDKALAERLEMKSLKHSTRTVAAEAVSKFKRLHQSGLIPGSRLLLWTCRDAVRSFTAECRRHARVRTANVTAHDSEFYIRQREYGSLFRAISDELDRRVSLSLPAHTRFFPCSLEVPLKIVGALDVAGRLVAASFRCYRCRQGTGLLQVFTANSDKPSEYNFYSTPYTAENKDPFPTIMITAFSPRMVRHFYLALFNVMYEVAQCVVTETIQWPCFSAVVFTQAYIERMAALSTLACLRPEASAQGEIPAFVYDQCIRLLEAEVENESWWTRPTRVGPEYFSVSGEPLDPALMPADNAWAFAGRWHTQRNEWRMHQLDGNTREGVLGCLKLFRDSRQLDALIASTEDGAFRMLWANRLHVQFGALSESLKPREPDRIGVLTTALNRWSAAADWSEYIELASFIPFLRLFEDDDSPQPLLGVLGALIRDCAEVWRDSDDPARAYDSARRFLVVYATMAIFRTHRQGHGVDRPCYGPEADTHIREMLKAGAADLLGVLKSQTPPVRPGRAYEACEQVWNYVLTPPTRPLQANYAYDVESAHPLLITGMVRFLVRLLHVHSIHAPSVSTDVKPPLQHLREGLRRIFLARQHKENDLMPVDHILELWSLQYSLSQFRGGIDYRFILADAMKAAGWDKIT